MKIAVIGAGNIGGTLGRKWAAGGHEVVFGVRDPAAEKTRRLLSALEGSVQAVSPTTAPRGCDVVLLAVPGRAMVETVRLISPELRGKILIDATNDMTRDPMHSLDLLRAAAPDSPVYRAFSNLGWEVFAEPEFNGTASDLFFCGDGAQVQTAVENLIAAIGLRPVFIGGLDQADVIDGLTRLYFSLAMGQGHGRRVGLRMLKT